MASAMFAELQAKKDNAAAGLNKVTADMKTKNRTDDAPVVAPAATTASAPAAKPAAKAAKKPSSLANVKGTWFCENYENTQAPVEIKDAKIQENVYIGNCKKATFMITGKVKSVSVVGCTDVQIQFDSIVSTFEVINCKKVKVWVMKQCATVQVDKSVGINVILTSESAPEFVQLNYSQSSEVLLTAPGKTDEDDPVEHAAPEMISLSYKRGADGSNTFEETIVRHHG